MPFNTPLGVGGALRSTQQTRQINPSQNSPLGRRNARNPIFVPNIGEDFSTNELEFVQIVDRTAAILHGDAPNFLETGGIPNPNLRRPVAHVDLFAIVRHTPAFAGITETFQELET